MRTVVSENAHSCRRSSVDALAALVFAALLVAMSLFTGCIRTSETLESLIRRTTTMADDASKLSAQVSRGKEMASRAVENATALRLAAEEQLEAVVRTGSVSEVSVVVGSLRKAEIGAIEAEGVAAEAIDRACKAADAAASARRLVDQAVASTGEYQARSFAEKAEHMAGVSQREAEKARQLLEMLKKKWLSLAEDPSLKQAGTNLPPATMESEPR